MESSRNEEGNIDESDSSGDGDGESSNGDSDGDSPGRSIASGLGPALEDYLRPRKRRAVVDPLEEDVQQQQ